MICPKCDQEFTDQCECGFRPKQLEAQPKWIVRHCATPGCFTAIRMLLSEPEPILTCKWCQRGESHAMHGKPAIDGS